MQLDREPIRRAGQSVARTLPFDTTRFTVDPLATWTLLPFGVVDPAISTPMTCPAGTNAEYVVVVEPYTSPAAAMAACAAASGW